MNRWYAVYCNEVFQYFAFGQYMKINVRANKEFQAKDIVTVNPTSWPETCTIDELLQKGYDVDIRVTMTVRD